MGFDFVFLQPYKIVFRELSEIRVKRAANVMDEMFSRRIKKPKR